MGSWLRRLAYLLRRSRHDAELREEIEAHRALRAADLERDGLTSQEAADASRRAIGNVLLAREESHEVWLRSWSTWLQDIRHGLRTFRSNPSFAAVAVLTLALGIGVNAGVFTVLNGVLFRDLPAPDAHELVSIAQTVTGGQITTRTGAGNFSAAEYRTYRDRARTLTGVLAHSNPTRTTLGGDTPQGISGLIVTCNYFAVLRQPPALGRALTARDCQAGADAVVVLGHALWNATFAADPAVVGRTIVLNQQRFTVVGVAAEGTYGGSPVSIGYFAPISADPVLGPAASRSADDTYLWLHLIGRRRGDAGIGRVRAELAVIAAQVDRSQTGRSTRLTIARATPMTLGSGMRSLAIGAAAVLMAAFGFILLIACANVANLLLARGTTRSREIAIRLSLGATRARLVRQLLTESLLLALAGGLIGAALARWSFESLVAFALPAMMPPWSASFSWDLSPDVRVWSFAVALTLGTGILFGLVPALHLSKPDLSGVIALDGAGSGRRGGRLRATLVGAQVALCMTLTISAGLLLRGLHAAYTVDPGFSSRDVGYASISLPSAGYSVETADALRQRFSESLETLQGVDAVAGALQTPFGDEDFTVPIRLPDASAEDARPARVNAVAPEYFSLLGLPLLRGRTFTETEIANRRSGVRAAIVSETTARNLWPGRDAIGQTLVWDDNTLHVVGVAADAQVSTLGAIDPYYFYVPGGDAVVLFKSRVDPDVLGSSIRAIARALDPTVVVTVRPLEANIAWQRGVSGTVTTLGATLGALALALAAVGIYGVVSYSVMRRHREIGIRLALGARARDVLGMVLRQTMRPVVIGAAVGLAGASAVSSVLSSVLFGVSPVDPVGLGGGALLVLITALAAAALAARPAMHADPTATLRRE